MEQKLRLRVVSCGGEVELEGVPAATTIRALPALVAERAAELCGDGAVRLCHRTRLLATLGPSATLADADVRDGDALVALPSRVQPSSPPRAAAAAKGPTAEEVAAATAHLRVPTDGPASSGAPPPAGVHPDSNLANLLSAVARLGGGGGSNVGVEGDAAEDEGEEEEEEEADADGVPELPPVDSAALAQLVEMGFTEERARKALLLSHQSIGPAMEWLLEVGDGPDADLPLTETQTREIARHAGLQGRRRRRRNDAGPQEPDEALLASLVEMGFSSEDAANALRATRNDYEMAAALLLGEATPVRVVGGGGRAGGGGGAPAGAPMLLGSILSNPAIQSGVRSDRVIEALQAMIEDPAAARHFLDDPEIGPILMELHRTLAPGGRARPS